jgi:hypothetical protein
MKGRMTEETKKYIEEQREKGPNEKGQDRTRERKEPEC